MRSALVIGGGVIGLSTALSLSDSGWEVTVLDRESSPTGCSYVNAGFIVPSHFIPLAAPGVIATGLKWMLKPSSPFAISFGSLFAELPWLLDFKRHATAGHVERAAKPLLELLLESRRIYLEWAKSLGIPLQARGLLMLYRTPEGERHELAAAEMARRIGLEPAILPADEIRSIDPGSRCAARGAVHYPLDCHLDPGILMQSLRAALEKRSTVSILSGCEAGRIDIEGNRVRSVRSSQGEHTADEYVVCAGVWSSGLLERIGVRLPLVGGKGYSFEVPNPGLSVPLLLSEARVAVTPLGERLRIAGTMEIGAPLAGVKPAKLLGMRQSFEEYTGFPIPPADAGAVRAGLRPVSPDGLPYLGRLARAANLSVAAGHAMLGVSLAAASGRAIARILDGGSFATDLQAFDPNRYL